MTTLSSYDDESIVVLHGLQAVRMRPAMYVGSVGAEGVNQLVTEVLQNSVDEAAAGAATHIHVRVDSDGRWTITDNGRGIPVGIHTASGRPIAEVVATELHAGGKFRAGAYHLPGGLHGVGLTCVNALSAEFEITVRRDGGSWRGQWKKGETAQSFFRVGDAHDHGTAVRFLPDAEIFGGSQADISAVEAWLRAQCWLTPGLSCRLEHPAGNAEFGSNEGIGAFVASLAGDDERVHPDPIVLHAQVGEVAVEAALLWTRAFSPQLACFVNRVHTPLGGLHADALRAAVSHELIRYARESGLVDRTEPLDALDTIEGLVAVLSVSLPHPQFEGQTKTRLLDPVAGNAVQRAVSETLAAWTAEHPAEAAALVGRAVEAGRARTASRRASDRARYQRVAQSVDKAVYMQQFGIRSKNWHTSADWITNTGLLSLHGGSSRLDSNATILDVCCGSGVVGASFRGKVGKIIGLDLTPEMVALARTRLDEVVQGDVYAIPFPDQSFDGVCNREVLHLLPQPERPLAQIYRVLKPGGQFVVGQWVPYGAIDGPWMFQITKKKQPLFVNNLYHEDMVALLSQAGFKDIEAQEYFQWEDIDNWIATWETPEIHRHQVRDLYHHCPAEVRAAHPFEISATGGIRDCWRWMVYSATKPRA